MQVSAQHAHMLAPSPKAMACRCEGGLVLQRAVLAWVRMRVYTWALAAWHPAPTHPHISLRGAANVKNHARESSSTLGA